MSEQIMVSVVCLAYNQQDFIRDTLQSFVEQKAAFRFEVVVHDDASSDGTADIIREYEQKYPSIIKGIYQREISCPKRNGYPEILFSRIAAAGI